MEHGFEHAKTVRAWLRKGNSRARPPVHASVSPGRHRHADCRIAERHIPHAEEPIMSIAKLRQIARLPLPFDASDEDDVDELRVLMAAGLITGLALTVPLTPRGRGGGREGPLTSHVIRVLAITPDGRRLLRRSDADGVGSGMREDGGGRRPTSH